MDSRDNKTPNLVKRDENNKLDHADAEKLKDELIHKLITETRAHEKENSFHVAKTGKRDIVVHLAVTILPQVDGHIVIGEQEKEVGQWCFRLNCRSLPARNSAVIKAFSELCHVGKSALMKIGLVTP